jgi:Flagellar biosynthesis protein, FliO.
MKVNISFREPFALKACREPVAAPPRAKFASECESFENTLRDFADASKITPLRNQQVRRVPPPKKFEPKPPQPQKPGLLSILFSKLRGQVAGTKKLKLVETVSLGEKRFVAIINADGCSYLVGGGSQGVALLAQLDNQQKEQQGIHTVPDLTELAV